MGLFPQSLGSRKNPPPLLVVPRPTTPSPDRCTTAINPANGAVLRTASLPLMLTSWAFVPLPRTQTIHRPPHHRSGTRQPLVFSSLPPPPLLSMPVGRGACNMSSRSPIIRAPLVSLPLLWNMAEVVGRSSSLLTVKQKH